MSHIHFTQAKAYDLFNAVSTFVYNPTIRAWLEANDPKALAQAIDALIFHEVEAARTAATAHPGATQETLKAALSKERDEREPHLRGNEPNEAPDYDPAQQSTGSRPPHRR